MSENVRTRFTILKWIPRVLMLIAIVFSVFLGWYLSKQQEKNADRTNAALGEQPGRTVIQKQNNIEYSHFDQGRLVYHVTAEQVETLKSEQQKLQNPEFIFYDENQKEMVRVTGKQCNISRDFNQITVIDDTHVVSESGMQVSSHMIKYDSRQQTFSTPGLANFKWRTLRGKSKGFTYSVPMDELDLIEDPEITYLKKEEDGRKPIVMVGRTGMIDRKNGFAFFEGDVEVTQERNKIKAHRIEATFQPGGNDLQKLTAIKDVKIKFTRPGLEGDEESAVDSQKPAVTPVSHPVVAQSGTAAQASSMSNVFSADATSSKDLAADFAELFFHDDGQTIKTFHSTGDCTFVLHTYDNNNRPQENRIIKGQNFEAQFNDKGDMKQFHADKDVSVKLQPIGNPKKEEMASKQMIYCDDLQAFFVPETGDVKRFTSMRTSNTSRAPEPSPATRHSTRRRKKKTDLIGEPEINDATFDITANNMELFEDTSGIHAHGNVKSSFVRSEGKTPTTFPFSSPSNHPVYISSEDMDWDSQKSEATYTDKGQAVAGQERDYG